MKRRARLIIGVCSSEPRARQVFDRLEPDMCEQLEVRSPSLLHRDHGDSYNTRSEVFEQKDIQITN